MLILPNSSYSFVKDPIFELHLLSHSPFKSPHIFYILPIYSAACFFFSICIHFAGPGLSCSMQDLLLLHVKFLLVVCGL